MPKHSDIYWYNESPFVKKAFLFNCRDDDLERSDTDKIESGTVVLGKNGVHIAEVTVLGFKAREPLIFCSTRRCEWQGMELQCMVHPHLGQKPLSQKDLRHKGCIVAKVVDDLALETAKRLKIPVVADKAGRNLINLSVERHSGQATERNAQLID